MSKEGDLSGRIELNENSTSRYKLADGRDILVAGPHVIIPGQDLTRDPALVGPEQAGALDIAEREQLVSLAKQLREREA